MERQGMRYGSPFTIRRDHPHLAHSRQGFGEHRQTRRMNPIIVGDQNAHGSVWKKKAAGGSFFGRSWVRR
jgi:hypothetical protein